MTWIRNFLRRCIISARYRLGLAAFILSIKMRRNVFVFGAPFHSNMGDQAQSFGIKKWANRAYPGYRVRLYETTELIAGNFTLMKQIRKYCNKGDKVFLHSGYHTTDLYMLEENMQRQAVQLFDDRQVVALPQTIYYQKEEEAEKARRIYNAHPDLLMMCRDEVSYQSAQQMFPNCRKLLFPDIVTTMIGSRQYNKPRKGILLCLRNDKEAFYSPEQIAALKAELEKIDAVSVTDTTIGMDMAQIRKNREKILQDIWREYAGYRAVVTDRYHGTIFSLIAATPVVVISSTDHKLSSGVKWFPESFQSYVRYEPELENIADQIRQIYQTGYDYRLEPYFRTHYYDSLRKQIEEE